MTKNLSNSATYCSIVDEFHVRNVLGCRERKVWMFGDIVTTGAAELTRATTLSELSNGVITSLRSYVVQIQKMGSAPINEDFITTKTTAGFALNCDAASDYSILVFGTENNSYGTAPSFEPKWQHEMGSKKSGKWAKDYCPGCKALDFWAICGSTTRDLATFGFSHILAGTSDVISFADYRVAEGSGQRKPLSQMVDNDYLIFITPRPSAAAVIGSDRPYPSSITETGFTLNGNDTSQYDVLIFGKVRF